MPFNVGDVVIGLPSASYSYTGPGSVCRVVRLDGHDVMTVSVIEPRPMSCEMGVRWSVEERHFILKQEGKSQVTTEKQKVEILKTYACEERLRYGSVCDEIAAYRVSVPGYAVTLCEAHGEPYKTGAKTLKTVACYVCAKLCKPGFVVVDGVIFCGETCRERYCNPVQA